MSQDSESGADIGKVEERLNRMLEEIKESQNKFNGSDAWATNPSPS